MSREELPNARPNLTINVTWNGHTFPVTVGFSFPDMRPMEIFADVAKGGDMQWLISDALIWGSIALQNGMTLEDLSKSLGTVPGTVWDKEAGRPVNVELPASPLGAVVNAIMEVQG